MSRYRQEPALVALGSAIKKLRVEKKISQEELSLRAGVDMSYVGRVERGDNNVAVLTLKKIATALEVTLTELMAEAEL